MDIKQRLADAAGETYGGSIGGPLTGGAELARDALAEIERLQIENVDTRLQLIADDQTWQDRRRFDLFFAAAITGLTSRKKCGTTDDIACNAALVALKAMGHKLPFNMLTEKASTGV